MIQFGDQSSVVIWNPEKKTQWFIRDASFDAEAKDFGFITPSPSVPKLKSADPSVFYWLLGKRPPRPERFSVSCSASLEAMPAGSGVEVMQEVDVAGMRAATLKANDAAGLAAWLKKNGYATNPSVEAWTKQYIDKGWYLTAFKVGTTGNPGDTGAVSMEIATDMPYHPYSVPASNRVQGARLRVLFLSPQPVQAKVGDTAWVQPIWRNEVPEYELGQLAWQLATSYDFVPAGSQLVSFSDPMFASGEAPDIFFHPASSWPATQYDDQWMSFHLAGTAVYLAGLGGVSMMVWTVMKYRRARSRAR